MSKFLMCIAWNMSVVAAKNYVIGSSVKKLL
jgi:hypothetical protein